jgi:hypothetical protein
MSAIRNPIDTFALHAARDLKYECYATCGLLCNRAVLRLPRSNSLTPSSLTVGHLQVVDRLQLQVE